MALFTKDRSFYRSLILLAVPISLQNLVTFAVNFADNVMIGSLGDDAISGVYVGGQLQSVVQMFVGGIEGAILILAAQYWGRKDRDSIRKVVSIGVKFALGGVRLLEVRSDPQMFCGDCENQPVQLDEELDAGCVYSGKGGPSAWGMRQSSCGAGPC